jgi:hypothetical protein
LLRFKLDDVQVGIRFKRKIDLTVRDGKTIPMGFLKRDGPEKKISLGVINGDPQDCIDQEGPGQEFAHP